MDLRLLFLTLPSALVLALLVVHSLLALPRWRALGFWGAVAAYGVLRRLALEAVVERGLAGAPYEIHDPLLVVLGVPLQEMAGWAVVAYLGWWLGHRLAAAGGGGEARVFPALAWGCLFLGAASWAVEAAAVAAGWWHWTLPVANPLLLGVPWIGPLDWAFVGIDFLLPFVVLTTPELRRRPSVGKALAWATVAAFPLHFAAHLVVGPPVPGVPIPGLHLAHWALAAVLLWLALRSPAAEAPFDESRRLGRWSVSVLPWTALGLMLLDLAVVDLAVAREPRLLLSLLPVAGLALLAAHRRLGTAWAALSLVAGLSWPSAALGAVPAGFSVLLRRRPRSRWVAAAAVVVLAWTAWRVHLGAERSRQELTTGLERAVAARDRGDLGAARRELAGLAERFPGSPVPAALLGEIEYRTGRLGEAERRYAEALAVQPSMADARRHLAVIHLRRGDAAGARSLAMEGLTLHPDDLELAYLAARSGREPTAAVVERALAVGPGAVRALAGLAFEVDDRATAAELVARGRARWPGDGWFGRAEARLTQ
ncbi:MAG TPA: tetratricopeptide repeat protein [Thermoanaerobaculia bacterium]|nr:tetratricopeptide repeat protein [Thermoanaerobaculia bacterium]